MEYLIQVHNADHTVRAALEQMAIGNFLSIIYSVTLDYDIIRLTI
jgi:hypothetical protein